MSLLVRKPGRGSGFSLLRCGSPSHQRQGPIRTSPGAQRIWVRRRDQEGRSPTGLPRRAARVQVPIAARGVVTGSGFCLRQPGRRSALLSGRVLAQMEEPMEMGPGHATAPERPVEGRAGADLRGRRGGCRGPQSVKLLELLCVGLAATLAGMLLAWAAVAVFQGPPERPVPLPYVWTEPCPRLAPACAETLQGCP